MCAPYLCVPAPHVLCEIGALTALVAGSACPTCRERKLAAREAAEKCKGLSSFLELRSDNAECSESVLSFTHTSKRINSVGECGGSGAKIRYDGRSSRSASPQTLPRPLHQKTFHGIAKKLHCAAMEAVSQNLEEAGRVPKGAVGGGDVPVMLDGTWQ
ncbi:hypothetical protein HPB50_027968 [Hyalomma asiaticum]|nr:hypothetical protein HPB50_027968 [Hyalomma asiaticum]